ncbi:MAG: hypothetical protein ACRDRH_01800 [Pseudonocardia sp.]
MARQPGRNSARRAATISNASGNLWVHAVPTPRPTTTAPTRPAAVAARATAGHQSPDEQPEQKRHRSCQRPERLHLSMQASPYGGEHQHREDIGSDGERTVTRRIVRVVTLAAYADRPRPGQHSDHGESRV